MTTYKRYVPRPGDIFVCLETIDDFSIYREGVSVRILDDGTSEWTGICRVERDIGTALKPFREVRDTTMVERLNDKDCVYYDYYAFGDRDELEFDQDGNVLTPDDDVAINARLAPATKPTEC